MKQIDKETENVGKKHLFVVVALVVVGVFLVSMAFTNSNRFGITTYLGEKSASVIERITNTFTKIINGETSSGSLALFDVNLEVPEKYKQITPGEDVSIVVQLVNFGETTNESASTNTPTQTNASISYIVTNSFGDVVFIEHENRVVETQDSYLKTLDLPYLEKGYYQILVELLYSDKSATANGEFRIV